MALILVVTTLVCMKLVILLWRRFAPPKKSYCKKRLGLGKRHGQVQPVAKKLVSITVIRHNVPGSTIDSERLILKRTSNQTSHRATILTAS